MAFTGIQYPEEFRVVTRSHVMAWRKQFEARELAGTTIRRKLSALSLLFDYLCEKNAVLRNPFLGVARPKANANEGVAPALSNGQIKELLNAPPENTLKGIRDWAILTTLAPHGLRRDELVKLRVE